jgi:hypothetical protein
VKAMGRERPRPQIAKPAPRAASGVAHAPLSVSTLSRRTAVGSVHGSAGDRGRDLRELWSRSLTVRASVTPSISWSF